MLMHYMPTQLTNSVKGDLHPASAKRSDGSLRSDCWELVRQSVGEELYKKQSLEMNFSPHAHPHNGKRTDIFSTEDSFVIIVLPGFHPVCLRHCCKNSPLFPSCSEPSNGFVRGEDSIPRIRQGPFGQVILRSERFFSDVLSS